MAGEGRIIFGLFLVTIGPFLLLTSAGFVFGILFLAGGLLLLYSGLVTAGVHHKVHEWRDLPRLVGLEVPRRAPPAASAPPMPPPSAVSDTPAPVPVYVESDDPVKYCASCGEGNPNHAAFCRKCNKPLPPPA